MRAHPFQLAFGSGFKFPYARLLLARILYVLLQRHYYLLLLLLHLLLLVAIVEGLASFASFARPIELE